MRFLKTARTIIRAVAEKWVTGLGLGGAVLLGGACVLTPAQNAKSVAPMPASVATAKVDDSADANEESDAQEEEFFQAMMASGDSQAQLDAHLKRMATLYFQAQTFLDAFDKDLDQAMSDPRTYHEAQMLTQMSYARLQAARVFMDDAQKKTVYIYRRLLQMESDSSVSRDEQERARELADSFRKSLIDYSSGAVRLGMQSLYYELLEVDAEVAADGAKVQGAAEKPDAKAAKMHMFRSVIEKLVLPTGSALANYAESHRSDLSVNAQASLADRVVRSDIESLAVTMQPDLASEFSERSKWSQWSANVIGPSAGPSGNMTGMNFKPGRWALTFDDGPSSAYTHTILDNLVAHHIHASFFWLAMNTPRLKPVVDRAKGLGMILGNHSFTHANLPKLKEAGWQHEIVDSEHVDQKQADYDPKFFRCPYGACGPSNSRIRQIIANLGLIHVLWNVDSLDWQDKNPKSILARVQKQMALEKRGIILFHDIHPQSVAASQLLMDSLAKSVNDGSVRLLTVQDAASELNSAEGMK